MQVTHYYLLGFFSGPASADQPAGGSEQKPRRRQPPHRPAWVLPVEPLLPLETPLEEDAELLMMLGVV